jgi:hypothetical protein
MRVLLLALFATVPGAAQFRTIEITFAGNGCASCLASLPERLQRLRGVESASVDADRGVVKIALAAQNRVRPEQVRDMVEQDGTRALSATVHVRGEVSQQGNDWVLRTAGLAAHYRLEASGIRLAAGTHIVRGKIADLRAVPLVVQTTSVEAAD